MPASNGGTADRLYLELLPFSIGLVGTNLYKFDITNFNDPNSSSFYSWKKEDVICGRQPTVNRLYISHRDFGVCPITATLTGNNDSGKVISQSIPVTLGTTAASGVIITTVFDQIAFTAQNPQLSVSRAANAGTMSITKVRMEGQVER
ncbi:MAG TPA: hypothetical protein VH187_18700 [Scandinavium sp.]|jgi:hypothetical protein|uniref:hypothetical protein n=1 Tax=Scandinavium sp. TaxID=2830653 RepID=UPI002E32A703|nr:hypothetical protein [Scandinavium sp.]HEX4503168.1 hypothetical protein [Scandinavium sp.]